MAQLVSTIDTDHVKSKNQDKESIPDDPKPLILLNLNGATDFDEGAECAGRVESLARKRSA